jgi:hypothetical protein
VQAFYLGPYAQPPLAQAAAPTKPDLSYQASSNLFTLGKGRMLDTDNLNAVSIYILVNLMIDYLGGASKFNDRIRVGVPQTFCKEANESWLYLTNCTRRPTGNTHREPWCNQHRLCDKASHHLGSCSWTMLWGASLGQKHKAYRLCCGCIVMRCRPHLTCNFPQHR